MINILQYYYKITSDARKIFKETGWFGNNIRAEKRLLLRLG